MSEWDNPISEKWTQPVKEQVDYYIRKIYMQGYQDALRDIEKEHTDE